MKKLLAFGALIAALIFIRADAQVVPAPPGTAAMVCANNTVVPTPTNGKFFYVQCDSNGKLITTATGGGGGSPGGTNGQIQYNASGSFGGFTASGDATVNTSTGVVSLKNTGPGATGPIGSATTTPVVTIDAQGRVTALTSATINQGVTSVATSCGVTGGPITTTGTISANITTRNTTATTDTITSTDCGTVVTESNASPVAVAITTAGFSSGNYFTGKNLGVGLVTYTPSSGTINGAATLACSTGQSFDAYFDGINFVTLGSTCGATATIASGTAALGTTLITAGACSSATTVSATGVATTDTITVGFNGDPTATTGYLPTAMLTIVPYPTSNNVNFKQCNLTASSITPSALTVNWKVVR